MDAETFKALEQVYANWTDIADGGLDFGSRIPLCSRYPEGQCWTDTETCPIAAKAKDICCRHTPYVAWKKHQIEDHGVEYQYQLRIQCSVCKQLADDMLAFLDEIRIFP
jgi:hypothetical protein